MREHFHKVVRLLEDQFTVLTYDRRGNSRSPCPEGWTQTSCDEQADDAAALLQTLGLAQASVFGSSSGAIIALNLALRHRALVQRLIVHEPPLVYAFAAPDDVMNQLTSLVECGRSSGGSRGAMEAFLRSVAGDANYDALAPDIRERMLGNADTFFDVEFGTFEQYRPNDAALASIGIPVQVMAGVESAPFFRQAAQWLAERTNTGLVLTSGAHTPYHDRPGELAAVIRAFVQLDPQVQ